MSILAGGNRKLLKKEILELESVLNEMCELKTKACSIVVDDERMKKLELIEAAIKGACNLSKKKKRNLCFY